MNKQSTTPDPDPNTSIRVKFLSKAQSADRDYERWLRRFPGRIPRMGNCDFIFEQGSTDYDWLAVYDDLPRKKGSRHPIWEEVLACPRERTILITTEPSSIKLYGHGFLKQFGLVLTSQETKHIRHPGAIYRQCGLVWFHGMTDERGTYDGLMKNIEPSKLKDLSTVCSSKSMKHTLHQSRLEFTRALQSVMPNMDVFGHGVREIDDKADALDPYRYHIAIENHICDHHWTEKLADPFLGYCLPFYHGCHNAADYFPEESFIPIDIHKFGETRERIEKAIRDKEYEKRLPAIREARRLVMEEYATFPQLSRLISQHHTMTPAPTPPDVILSRRLWRKRHPLGGVALACEKFSSQIRNRLTYQTFSADS